MTEFAEALGMGLSSLRKYLNGERRPGVDLQAKLRALGCDIEWLMTGEEKVSSGDTEKSRLQSIPVYESVHAGPSNPVFDQDPVEHIAVPPSRDKTLFGVKVRGDCMEPVISEGDTVVVSRTAEVRSGEIALVAFQDHEYQLRTVDFKGDIVLLTPRNEKHPRSILDKKKIRSMLKVVGIYKDLSRRR